jgi:hypothetical protein
LPVASRQFSVLTLPALYGSLKTPGSYQGIASAMPQMGQKRSRLQPLRNGTGEGISFAAKCSAPNSHFQNRETTKYNHEAAFLRPIRQRGPLTTGN